MGAATPEARVCSAPDCQVTFTPKNPRGRYCSDRCRGRALRWRRYGAPDHQRVPYHLGLRLDDDRLLEARDQALGELVHAALSRAPADHLSRVATFVVRVDRQLLRNDARG